MITLMKTDERTRQFEKRFVGRAEFLPADHEPARTIEPGEQPLHHPTSGLLGWFQVVDRFRLGWIPFERFLIPLMVVWVQRRMGFVAPKIEVCINRVVIIAGIQAQVLRLLHSGLRSLIALGIQGSRNQLHIVAMGSLNEQGQWDASTITQQAPFGSLFAAIGGSGADGGLGKRGFDRRTIQTLPVPADPHQFIVLLQSCLPQALEEALTFPQAKPVVDGARSSQFPRQRIPLDASTQYIDNRRKHLPIISGGSPRFGLMRAKRGERAHTV